jgi:hypothetical protein
MSGIIKNIVNNLSIDDKCFLENENLAFFTTQMNGTQVSVLCVAKQNEYIEVQHSIESGILIHYASLDKSLSMRYVEPKNLRPLTIKKILEEFTQEKIPYLDSVPEQFQIEGHRNEQEKEMCQQIMSEGMKFQIQQTKHIRTLKLLMDEYGIEYKK